VTETRFNIPPDLWARGVDEIYELLADVARRSTTITYGDVAQLESVTLEPDSRAFHHMLGDVSVRAVDLGAPLLSAVVVHRGGGRPGRGFCELARRLGFEMADDPIVEDVFWGRQIEAVHAWWRR